MARYVVHVRSSKAPPDGFADMADVTNLAERDPGVERADQILEARIEAS